MLVAPRSLKVIRVIGILAMVKIDDLPDAILVAVGFGEHERWRKSDALRFEDHVIGDFARGFEILMEQEGRHAQRLAGIVEAGRIGRIDGELPRGMNVGAGEIETALLGHPGVAEAAVVGLPDEDLGQRIVAFVVGDAEPQELIDYVAQQLSVHKRPREVRIVDSLPRNAMGKVLKKELLTRG